MDGSGLGSETQPDVNVHSVADEFLSGDLEFSVIPTTDGETIKDDTESLVNALGISNSEGIELGMPSGEELISMEVSDDKGIEAGAGTGATTNTHNDNSKMDIDSEETGGGVTSGGGGGDSGPLAKLRNTQLLPELFNLLHDLRNGTLLAKDFGSNAGSLRLKLTTFKQCLQEIEGVNESIEDRQKRIQVLSKSKAKKEEFLRLFKDKIKHDLDEGSIV